MASVVFVIEKLAVFAIVLAIVATWAWALVRMNRRARNSGYRYGLIDPRAQFTAAWGLEMPIVFGVLLIGLLALFGLSRLA